MDPRLRNLIRLIARTAVAEMEREARSDDPTEESDDDEADANPLPRLPASTDGE